MFNANLQVGKPVLQVFLILNRFKSPTLWEEQVYTKMKTQMTQMRWFLSLSQKAERLYKNKRNMHKSRHIINNCRFASMSQLKNIYVFWSMFQKLSVLFGNKY